MLGNDALLGNCRELCLIIRLINRRTDNCKFHHIVIINKNNSFHAGMHIAIVNAN